MRCLFRRSIGLSALALLFICGVSTAASEADRARVVLMRVPDGGIQPQAALDDQGMPHLIYFHGDPGAGDLFYVRGTPEGGFSKPIRVNGQPGSVMATGTVRGAHMAIGKGGRVHVSWMGSKVAEPKGPSDATPMLYARLNDEKTAFEPQRNVMRFAVGLDGGGSVAADRTSNVYVAWHGEGDSKGEAHRRIWVARSTDEGETFSRELAANAEPTGACGCCGMRAFADSQSWVYLLYRAATGNINRDMYLLVSKDGGRTFQGTRLHVWKRDACPMSTASIAEGSRGALLAWETDGQVYYAEMDRATLQVSRPIAMPGAGGGRKHPVVAGNAQGETIVVWTEGTGWKKGGSLAWQVFDKIGRPSEDKGTAQGISVWGLAAVLARADGGFTIIY